MNTPSPLDRVQRGSLVPTPDQHALMRSTSAPHSLKAFPASSSVPNLFRQSLASGALVKRSKPPQTPKAPTETATDIVKSDSPYRSVGSTPPADRALSSFSASSLPTTPTSQPTATSSRSVLRLSPTSANALGRARAAKTLRRSLVSLFFYVLVATSRVYRWSRLKLAVDFPIVSQSSEWIVFFFVAYHVITLLHSIYLLAIPGAAAIQTLPAGTPATVPKGIEGRGSARPAASPASSSAKPSPFLKSSPKTRPSLPPLPSPRAYSRSPSLTKSQNAPPPPAKGTPSRSPGRAFYAERPMTPDQLRASLLGASAQPVSALGAFQARHPAHSDSPYRRASTGSSLQRLKAEAALAVAG